MLKRLFLLCVILLLFTIPVLACEHTDSGEVADQDLRAVNRVPPQEGISGSEDLVCPICGDVIEHVILPALPAPAAHPASSDEEQAAQKEQPVQPVQKEQSVQPAQPENPAKPENPVPQSDDNGAITVYDGSDSSQSSSYQPPKAEDVIANEKPQTGGSSGSSGSGGRTGAGRTNAGSEQETNTQETAKSQTFPFRRMKMKPKPGIRAEAAGQLLWPVYGTPFQNIYND